MCDEIIDAEKTKTILKNVFCETKSFYNLIDGFQYLLLPDKIYVLYALYVLNVLEIWIVMMN